MVGLLTDGVACCAPFCTCKGARTLPSPALPRYGQLAFQLVAVSAEATRHATLGWLETELQDAAAQAAVREAVFQAGLISAPDSEQVGRACARGGAGGRCAREWGA